MFFFFQAEDGIRDLVRSRGLGDVYKRQVLGRSYRVMQDGFTRIQARLPFAIRELHPDNGSEFFNDHLVTFWKELVVGVRLSRSRPYHKNDNRFVEQKNDTLVRAYLGNERLDTVAQTLAMNLSLIPI